MRNCGEEKCKNVCQLNWWFTWNDYVEETLAKHKPHTRDVLDIRLGQKLFNALCEYRADIADQIRGSAVDPFNDDDMVPAFLEKVDELWTL